MSSWGSILARKDFLEYWRTQKQKEGKSEKLAETGIEKKGSKAKIEIEQQTQYQDREQQVDQKLSPQDEKEQTPNSNELESAEYK